MNYFLQSASGYPVNGTKKEQGQEKVLMKTTNRFEVTGEDQSALYGGHTVCRQKSLCKQS